MTDLVTIDQVRAAAETIAGQVVRTPAIVSPGLSARLGCPATLKLELLQKSGCFKPRGIVNKIAALNPDERAKGLITVSGGNHGIATAMIAREMGLAATIVMPEKAPERSKDRIRNDGATLILVADVSEAFQAAEAERAKGLTYLHSYDDPLIIAGHGTVGLELLADAPDLTDVLVSIGGGGLISGVATALKALKPTIRIWGVETEGAEAMTAALKVDAPVNVKVTSISSTLGAPNATERTLAHVKALVERVLLVPDRDAVAGMVALAEDAKLWVEPAAGCLVPAADAVLREVGPAARLGLVICGGNVTHGDVRGWLDRFGMTP
ncbi:MAG: pyridoxal-phosphate dependent enzyme [Alphaproteobacteria bacterium]